MLSSEVCYDNLEQDIGRATNTVVAFAHTVDQD